MRLNMVLIKSKLFEDSRLEALMALMCFQSSRFDSRIGEKGQLLTLEEQDRTHWNEDLVRMGKYYLDQSTDGIISEYHLQAALAAHHSLAPSYEETDWKQILKLYDVLMKIRPDAIVKLNRVVAFSKVHGAAKAINELGQLPLKELNKNHLYYAICASLYQQIGSNKKAQEFYKKALALTINKSEEIYLKNKLSATATF